LHQVKRLPYTQELKAQFQKTQAWYTYFKKRHVSKKKPRFLLSSYIKIKNIPFFNIYKEFNIYFIEKYKINKIKKMHFFYFEQYLNKIKKIENLILIYKSWIFDLKYKKMDNRLYFFKKYYRNFVNNQKNYI